MSLNLFEKTAETIIHNTGVDWVYTVLTSFGIFHIETKVPVLISSVKPWVGSDLVPNAGPFTANNNPPEDKLYHK